MFRYMLAVSAVALVYGQAENLLELATKLGANELVKLIAQADLNSTLTGQGPFTLLAPSDEAFHRIPQEVIHNLMNNKTRLTDLLKFHVVNGTILSHQLKNEELLHSLFPGHDVRANIYHNGRMITLDGAPVARPDQNASNGVIHVLHKVMLPIPEGTIATAVSHEPMLSTLLKAVQTANLTTTLQGGPFTLFAPTNEAFNHLPEGALDKLLANVTTLTDVLKYHLLNGTVYGEGLTNGVSVVTLEGKQLTVRKGGPGHLMVGNATVERPDHSVMNGVIHMVNNVLLPPQTSDDQ